MLGARCSPISTTFATLPVGLLCEQLPRQRTKFRIVPKTDDAKSEQPFDKPLIVQPDHLGRGNLGQARHRHDLAADHHDEARPR